MANVCFFRLGATPLLVPDSTEVFGGAEVRAVTFARGLSKYSDHRVSMAVAAGSGLPSTTIDGIHVCGLPSVRRGWQKLRASVYKRILKSPLPYPHFSQLPSGTEVVACFGVHDPTAGVIAAARKTTVKSILFLTSSEDVDPPNTERASRHRRGHDYAIRCADQVVVQTQSQLDHLRSRFARDGQLIRNPIDTQSLVEASGNHPYVLWIGRADRDSKRADICLDIARKCPELSFTVVMNDTDSNSVDDFGRDAPANVSLHRHVELSQVEQLFADAAVLINTSNSEGFPNTFLQAAKYGVPIFSLNVDPDGMLAKYGCGELAGSRTRLIELLKGINRAQPEQNTLSLSYVRQHHELSRQVELLNNVLGKLAMTSKTQRAA